MRDPRVLVNFTLIVLDSIQSHRPVANLSSGGGLGEEGAAGGGGGSAPGTAAHGFAFLDNGLVARPFGPSNGCATTQLPAVGRLSACLAVFADFDRYSQGISLVSFKHRNRSSTVLELKGSGDHAEYSLHSLFRPKWMNI